MKLYNMWLCPYCRKVRKELRRLGVEHETVWVSFHPSRWREVEQLSGKSMVPLLVDGEKVINESEDICEYLRNNYGKAS